LSDRQINAVFQKILVADSRGDVKILIGYSSFCSCAVQIWLTLTDRRNMFQGRVAKSPMTHLLKKCSYC